ncbi:MAG: CotH kinase family protein [Flavobacteriaceae bacterium]|nr:CotH kinase family protein [Flavobacteriaceae bacterium]
MKTLLKTIYISILLTIFFSCNNEKVSFNDDDTTIIANLPQVNINTYGNEIVDEPKIKAEMTVIIDDEIDFTGNIGIEIRGSSSQMFPKKQFGVETRDANEEGISFSILGFPEEEDWILSAPYSDKSLMRNILIYDLSRDMNRYASRAKFVEVSINGEYNGLYILMEKLKRDSNRIDINKLKVDENIGEDLTGGYILKIDKASGFNETLYNDTNAITSHYAPNNASNNQKIYFNYDTPDFEEITPEQKAYITNFMYAFEDALAGSNFTDTTEGYRKYIDTQSFIDFFLLNELSNNVDGYRLSTWLTKDKNEKLKMGPIWDFNLAFGNANYCGGAETNVWAYKFNERCSQDFWQIPFWWDRLLSDPVFVSELKTRWVELRSGILSNQGIIDKIENYKNLLITSKAADNNFERWPVLDQYIWPNNYIGNTYSAEINYLKSWIQERTLWLDVEIMNL